MLRHPFYLLCCLFAVGYLMVADARGWSFLHSVSTAFTSNRAFGSGARTYHHK
jgi:hypothetical protein